MRRQTVAKIKYLASLTQCYCWLVTLISLKIKKNQNKKNFLDGA